MPCVAPTAGAAAAGCTLINGSDEAAVVFTKAASCSAKDAGAIG